MTQEIFTSGATEETRTERAQAAVRAFRAMQPGLTGYAQAITGRRDVTVEVSTGAPRTDGKKIYFRPPIALGDLTPHQRGKCERRDPETLLQLCPACAVREDVLIKIYHEIAHIVFGTFEPPTDEHKRKAVERAIEEAGGKYAARIRESWARVPDYKKNDYMNLSSLISPFLPVLINALEDSRVDTSMFKARRGTKVMFDAMTKYTFMQGVEGDDGELWSWNTRPLNSQIIIAIFCVCHGYDIEGWFSPEVEEAMKDAKLRELCGRIDTLRSAEGTYNLAFPILARLRELGFCRRPEEPEDDIEKPQPEQDPENNEEQQDDDDSSDDPEDGSDGQDQDQGDPDASEEGSSSDEVADEPSDEGDSDDGDGDPSEGTDGDAQSDRVGDPGDEGSSDEGDDGGADEPADGDAESRGDSGQDGAGESESELEGSGDPGDEADGAGGSESGDGDATEAEEGDDAGGAEPSEDPGNGSSDGGDLSDGAEDSGSAGEGEPGEEGSEPGDTQGANETGPADEDEGKASDSEQSADESSEAPAEPSGEPGFPEQQGPGGDLTDGDDSDSGREDDGEEAREPEGAADDSADEANQEVVDTGADEGKGGTEVESKDYGSPDDALNDVQVFGQHEVKVSEEPTPEQVADEEEIDQAIIQGMYFETPSVNIAGVREHKYGQPVIVDGYDMSHAWARHTDDPRYQAGLERLGIKTDLTIPEDILGPALMEMRRTFADNARAKHERHLRAGKINARVLGKRAPFGDDRLFQKKRLPGKKSYAVILGIDISGSTVGRNIALAKRAAMAQAELCHRTGIDFAIYAHTANGHPKKGWGEELWLDMYEIKAFDTPWADQAKRALDEISSDAENLDGHGLEYYRKVIERHPATDKIILYYSDGKMPAANYDEELAILQREISYCRAHQITLMGVGIRTDSPRRHGLDTVQVDTDSDIAKVVRHLQSGLLRNR